MMRPEDPEKSIFKFFLWILLPISAGIFLASLPFSSFGVTSALLSRKGALTAELLTPEIEKPQYYYTNRAATKPRVTAQAYMVGDLDTGEVILAQNEEDRFPIASVSKLMTALITSKLAKPADVVEVSKRAIATLGHNGELRAGENIKAADLVYPLLLESSNDAAEALAEYFGRANFIRLMNEQAQNFLLTKTSFEDPSGLSPNNISTAADLFKLAGHIKREHGEIFDISTKRSLSAGKHNWYNISKFLGKSNYVGGKSGFTNAAMETGVAIFNLPLGENSVRPVAITLLRSRDRERDVETILKYLAKNIYYGGKEDAAHAWVEKKSDLPAAVEPDFITFTFLGDIMLDRGVRSSVAKNFNNDYSALFAKIKPALLKNSDIAFANLEGTASDKGKDLGSLYSFRMDPSIIPALAGAGLDIVSMANNHIGDWGKTAFEDTLPRLKENEILYTGGGLTEAEAENPVIIEKHGILVGFLGFSDVGPKWMEAGPGTAGILLAGDPRFEEIIKDAAQKVDFLVVSFHWGDEYQTVHNDRQEHLAHRAVDNGAKLVIGHHPHVVEDTEVYKNGFIAYSLGNFLFDQSWSKSTMQGLLLQAKIWKDGTLAIKKNTAYLNSVFQLDRVVEGKEEKIKFQKTQD